MKRLWISIGILSIALVSAARGAAALPRAQLRIPQTSQPPTIDDFVRNRPRQVEAVVRDFQQREPADGRPVSHPTEAYLSYDEKQIYVVFVCHDAPEQVRARLAKREDFAGDDKVTVSFDTFLDAERAYTFAANPLGVQLDSIATEGQKPDTSFDSLWYSEGRLTSDGFIVWMAIPFKSLRFPNHSIQRWGIALGRTLVRNREVAFWPHMTKRVAGFVSQMAVLEGLEGISSGRNIQVSPHLNVTQARILNQPTSSWKTLSDARHGLDSKVILRDSLTLDLTLNPDFSHVESDDLQVNVNQRYEVIVPEKRPFFTENAGYFATPLNLFFSRRIVEPEMGARLTGKLGGWSIGALVADDRAAGQRLSKTEPLFGEHAAEGVVRVQRPVGRQSQFGLFTSSRDFGSSWNRVLSVDHRLRVADNWYFTGQLARSLNRELNGKMQAGVASSAEVMHDGRQFSYLGAYSDISPGFRVPLGVIRRTDVRQTRQYVAYNWQREGASMLSLGPSLSGYANWDHTGRLQDWSSSAVFSLDLEGPLGFTLGRSDAYERYLERGFRTNRDWISFYVDWARWASFYGSYGSGIAVNYSPPMGTEPFRGESADTSLGLGFRLTPGLRLDLSYYYSVLRSGSTSVFTNQMARSKINYQFTRGLSARVITDYYALLPNSGWFAQENYKHLTFDALLTYALHQGTALYLGYSNRRENLFFDPQSQRMERHGMAPTTMTGSQVFVKINYQFRF